jgi:hypothetical protein
MSHADESSCVCFLGNRGICVDYLKINVTNRMNVIRRRCMKLNRRLMIQESLNLLAVGGHYP